MSEDDLTLDLQGLLLQSLMPRDKKGVGSTKDSNAMQRYLDLMGINEDEQGLSILMQAFGGGGTDYDQFFELEHPDLPPPPVPFTPTLDSFTASENPVEQYIANAVNEGKLMPSIMAELRQQGESSRSFSNPQGDLSEDMIKDYATAITTAIKERDDRDGAQAKYDVEMQLPKYQPQVKETELAKAWAKAGIRTPDKEYDVDHFNPNGEYDRMKHKENMRKMAKAFAARDRGNVDQGRTQVAAEDFVGGALDGVTDLMTKDKPRHQFDAEGNRLPESGPLQALLRGAMGQATRSTRAGAHHRTNQPRLDRDVSRSRRQVNREQRDANMRDMRARVLAGRRRRQGRTPTSDDLMARISMMRSLGF